MAKIVSCLHLKKLTDCDSLFCAASAGTICCNVQADGTCPNNALFNVRAWVTTLGMWDGVGTPPDNTGLPNDGAVLLVRPAAQQSITPVPLALTSLFGQQAQAQQVTLSGFPAQDNRFQGCDATITFRDLRSWTANVAPVNTPFCPLTAGAASSNCLAYVGSVCGGNSGGPMFNANRQAFGIASFAFDCGTQGLPNDQSFAGINQIVNQGQNEGTWVESLIRAVAAS